MSKKFNVKAIVDERKNELDSSPLFQSQKPVFSMKDESPSDSPTLHHLDSKSNRSFVRRTFDFYEEQIKFLKSESLKDQLAELEGSMNAMVREAIDDWMEKRASSK